MIKPRDTGYGEVHFFNVITIFYLINKKKLKIEVSDIPFNFHSNCLPHLKGNMSQSIGKMQKVDKKELLVVVYKLWLMLPLLLTEFSQCVHVPVADICEYIKSVYLAKWILQYAIIGKCHDNHQIVVVDSDASFWYDTCPLYHEKREIFMRWHKSFHIRCDCQCDHLPIGTSYHCDEISGGQVSFTTFDTSLYEKYTGKKRAITIVES